jgi:hypothetical protein
MQLGLIKIITVLCPQISLPVVKREKEFPEEDLSLDSTNVLHWIDNLNREDTEDRGLGEPM